MLNPAIVVPKRYYIILIVIFLLFSFSIYTTALFREYNNDTQQYIVLIITLFLFIILLSFFSYSYRLAIISSAISLIYSLVLLKLLPDIYNGFQIIIIIELLVFLSVQYKKELNERMSIELEIEEQIKAYNEQLAEYQNTKTRLANRRKQLKRMNRLNTIAEKFTGKVSIEGLLDTLFHETAALMEHSAIQLARFNSIKNSFIVRNAAGYTKDITGLPGDSLVNWIWDMKRPIFIKDTETEMRFHININERFSHCRSIIAAPVILSNDVAYVIRLEHQEAGFYSEPDLRLLKFIADFASIVLQNLELLEYTRRLAITDGITGLYVRQYLIERLNDEIYRARNYNTYFSLIILDIDHFKEYNDMYGHQAGDRVLVAIADIIKKSIRTVDFAARYGGDEFFIILPETDIQGTLVLAERLHHKVNELSLQELLGSDVGDSVLTVSQGVGEYKNLHDDTNTFISRVDSAMYQAKANGRNGFVPVKNYDLDESDS